MTNVGAREMQEVVGPGSAVPVTLAAASRGRVGSGFASRCKAAATMG
jgi:hypothetical protein